MSAGLRPPRRAAIWRESLAVFEPGLLALNSVKLARQPRGNGHPVLVLPGFGAGDLSTSPLRRYLRSLGHDARGWGLGQNTGDVVRSTQVMIDRVTRIAVERGEAIPLVGWSLGGVIAREVARERPDVVSRVITFGSPVVGGPKYTSVSEVYRARGVDVDAIEVEVERRRATHISVPVTAIYARADGIVSWRACIDHVNPGVEHVEVRSTHLGMGLHHEVYAIIANRLATPVN